MAITTSILFCVATSIGCGRISVHHATSEERWPGQDPANTRPQLVVVGDSIMYRWTPSLQKVRYGVLNHAIGGQRAPLIAEYFKVDALDYHPAAVLIEGGINDLMGGTSVDRIIQHRIHMVRAAHTAGVKVYLANMLPSICATPGVDGQRALEQINAVSKALCATGQCTLVDFYGAFGSVFERRLFSDCVHPSEEGNDVLTRAFLEVYR